MIDRSSVASDDDQNLLSRVKGLFVVQPGSTWEPSALRSGRVALALLLHILLVAAISALVATSHKFSGFVQVSEDSLHFARNIVQDVSLAWTTGPTLVFQLFNLLRNAATDASAKRTPFAELAARDTSTNEESA